MKLVDNKTKNNRQKNTEIKIYEKLGVKSFQKCVFLLEKIIHFKDKGTNVNYHMKSNCLNDADDFTKFLFYNGSIHVKNAIFLSLALIAKVLFFNESTLMLALSSCFIGVVITKDLYCVMLQRYNFVRIKTAVERKKEISDRKAENDSQKIIDNSISNTAIINLSKEEKEADIKLIEELQSYLKNINDVVITEKDIEKLIRIREIIGLYHDIKTTKVVNIDVTESVETSSNIDDESHVLYKNII